MSFFGFDPSGHNQAAPGFSQSHDPFAGLSGRRDNVDDALEFEDTYDGLGDQLDETDDALNDDTFGGGAGPGNGRVGKDFDFYGQTAQVSNVIEEEHMVYSRHQPTAHAAPAAFASQATSYNNYAQQDHRPARTGYEKYQGADPRMDLQVDAALWGVAPKKQATPVAHETLAAPPRKMLSLEEVEAAMRAESQAKKQAQASPLPAQPLVQQQAPHQYAQQQQAPFVPQIQRQAQPGFESTDYYSRPNHMEAPPSAPSEQQRANEPRQQHHGHGHPVQILQRPQSKSKQHQPNMPQAPSPASQQRAQGSQPIQPTQILQNPSRLSGDAARMGAPAQPAHPAHQQDSLSRQGPIITHPSQVTQLSENEKAAYLDQEARRAKRNHKIYILSRDNGIMTPHDKNFITRIQLQQLVSATGNPSEHGTDEALAEDFYYQVHNQIRGGLRQNPSQPLNNFAQTYLYQTGSRQGGSRRHQRGPENHMQRMEQQVQRAVEAAKNKPKNSQLVIEGSLGKISFSNAKTPKPLLNIKRTESGDVHRQHTSNKLHPGFNHRAVLQDIENVYSTLMKMEDHDRKMPPPVANANDTELIQANGEWHAVAQRLNEQLWRELKVHEPLGGEGASIHPFIAMLELPKGKKAIPRVFRHTSVEQRTTILTMVIVHLDKIDVVRRASITDGQVNHNAKLREDVDLFSVAVSDTLFGFMGELALDLNAAVLGLISNLNVDLIARTRVGVGFLTMVLSRPLIITNDAGGKDAIKAQNEQSWKSWYVLVIIPFPH